MATGGSLAGLIVKVSERRHRRVSRIGGFLFDCSGGYSVAFMASVAANAVNLAIIGILLLALAECPACTIPVAKHSSEDYACSKFGDAKTDLMSSR